MDANLSQSAARKRRRPFLYLLLGAVSMAAALPTAAGATTVSARSANSFVESIGVNTHTYYSDTAYKNFSLTEQRLRELGIHHIRENLVTGQPSQYQHLNQLAKAGIKSDLILGSPANGSKGLAELVSIVGSELQGSVDSVEGPNEYDLSGDPEWMSKLGAYQAQLYSAIKSNPATSSLPVVGPSLGNTNSEASDISGSMDYGNMHSYPNGEAPELNFSWLPQTAEQLSGTKPLMATETGYHTAVNWSGDHKPVSEAVEATYMPRLFLEYFRRGVARTYSYELVDEFPNPGLDEPEKNFGLLRNDFSPKPAFDAVRNLTSILSDPSPNFSPGSLDYSVSGNQDELRQVLLQKSDGSYYLALWRASSVWNNRTHTPISAPSSTINLSFAQAPETAEEYQPTDSAQPLRTLAISDGSISVNVGPQVTIVQLGSVAEPAGRIKAWTSKGAVQSGGRVVVHGTLPKALAGEHTTVTIQRWVGHWRTVARSRTASSGTFRKTVRLVAKPHTAASRLRVVARRAKPSNQVRVRVLNGGRKPAPIVAVAGRRAAKPASS